MSSLHIATAVRSGQLQAERHAPDKKYAAAMKPNSKYYGNQNGPGGGPGGAGANQWKKQQAQYRRNEAEFDEQMISEISAGENKGDDLLDGRMNGRHQ